MNELATAGRVIRAESFGIYVHIPFCVRKCPYCDFASAPAEAAERASYLDSLEAEIGGSEVQGRAASSVYLGGGTPSELDPEQLERIVRRLEQTFEILPDAEFSIECNPGTLTREKLAGMRALRVNRVSLGVQSFNDRLLASLGRIHSGDEARAAYQLLREAGFQNVNLDLLFALPGQSLKDWKRDLVEAITLRPEHLSLYSLAIEPSTEFGRLAAAGRLSAAEDDLAADMYEGALDLTSAGGYAQYEISNFALPDRQCRHNLVYWHNQEYLGFGLSAASYISGRRWVNTRDLPVYVRQAVAGRVDRSVDEVLRGRSALGEEIMLRLRLNEGFSIPDLTERHGIDLTATYAETLDLLGAAGLLVVTGERVELTRAGRLLANEVCSRFL
jgi:oxygen-independent coproporphyrinogen III oxidase